MTMYYYFYVLDDNNFVHEVHADLTEEQKKAVINNAPFGFTVREYNKYIPRGGRFPHYTQEMNVKNICNVVILGNSDDA